MIAAAQWGNDKGGMGEKRTDEVLFVFFCHMTPPGHDPAYSAPAIAAFFRSAISSSSMLRGRRL